MAAALTASDPRPRALIAKAPIHPMFASAAASCFVGTLLTDIAYWRSANIIWADFSTWLVTVGVVAAVVTLLAGIFDYVDGRVLHGPATWPYVAAQLAALVLALFNMLIHTRDAWTSVVPWGLTLSGVVVVMLLLAGWMGRSKVYRYGVSV
jgi:uncharacterized membrane protein